MRAPRTYCRLLASITLSILAMQSRAAMPARRTLRPAEKPVAQSAPAAPDRGYGKLPLAFEPNLGQTDSRVRFLARGGGMTTFFTDTEMVMVLSRSRKPKKPERPGPREAEPGQIEQSIVRMRLEHANRPRRAAGLEVLAGVSNYFIGNDPAKWRTDIPHFGRIEYESVYPGIDLVWYGNQQRLEYDFMVAPGADPRQIQIAYEGVESLEVDAGGDLVLHTSIGDLRQQRPSVYQQVGGRQVEVGARYSIVAGNRVGFALARYDRARELRIDPVVLFYSTYLGGSGLDYAAAIAVDGKGSSYVTGSTYSPNFPAQPLYQTAGTVFVTKLTPLGDGLVYSTYLGGGNGDSGLGIAVDASGSAYITGSTKSADFPTQSPYQAALRGGVNAFGAKDSNAFVTKLAPAGNLLVYSTYLGGSGNPYGGDSGASIAVDGSGSAYVTGATASIDFPTQSPFQATFRGGYYVPSQNSIPNAFVTKFTPAGNALVYSTYLGGSGNILYGGDSGAGIAVDSSGSAYVTGGTSSINFPTQSPYQAALRGPRNAFVTKLTPAGNELAYSTYLGGGANDSGAGIAVDGSGSAYVTGSTSANNFPTQSPYQATLHGVPNAFVTKFAAAGNALSYSTYLGGSNGDSGRGIAVDGAGSAYVTGDTASSNFPVQLPYQGALGGPTNAFVTKFTPAGNSLSYSTYLGGSGAVIVHIASGDTGYGIAVDQSGSAYVAGATVSYNFPTQAPYQASLSGTEDAFVTKLLVSVASLSIEKTHVGNFAPGQVGATYVVTVSNTATAAPTAGIVTVTETIPAGMTLVSMSGTGWTCPLGGTTCARSDPLNGGVSYPAITVTVNVASNAATLITNHVSVSGGSSPGASAADTTIVSTCTPVVSPTSPGIAAAAGTLTLALSPGSCGWAATSSVSWLTPASAFGTGGTLSVAVAANTTGTQRSGTLTVAGQTVIVTQSANNSTKIPSLVSLSPFQGTGPNAALTLVYGHPNGWAAIQSAEFIVNPRWEPTNRSGGCYVKYAPVTGLFTLISDDGAGIAGTAAPGSSTSISNSQCILNAAASSATGNGATLTLVAALTFSASFSGQRHIWMQAVDDNNLSTNWLVYGVWFPTQRSVNAIPWYRIYDPFSKSFLYSADQNEYNTLGARGFTLQGVSGLAMDSPTTVGGVSNLPYYRVFVTSNGSHFWTSDRNEYLTLINQQQAYVGEGVGAFVMPYINVQGQVSPPVANSIRFWRAAYQGANLHFWTSDPDEYNGTHGKQLPTGYVGEGVACYIFPASGAQLTGNAAVSFAPVDAAADDGGPAEISPMSGVNPSILGTNQYGKGNAQARNEDGTANSPEHPAPRGSAVTLYTTGFRANGLPIEVHIGGRPAEVISTHISATRAGVVEVQLRVPEALEPADFHPVVLHVGNAFSQPGVGLAVH